MPKPARIDRPVMKNLSLPSSIVVPVEFELYSELEGRVPHGAWAGLMTQLLQDWLAKRQGARKGETS